MSNNKDKNKIKPLAIVGIACLFPKANNPNQYWINIREGIDAISNIPDTHWKPSDYFDKDKTKPDMTYAKRGGFINQVDFNPFLYGLSPNNIEATDTTQLLGMVVAHQVLLDAGYSTGKDANDGRQFDRKRTGVILGVTGTLELVIPLGARLSHPIWRKALADAGVDPETAEDVVQRIADGYVPWQENSFPGLLGNVVAGRIANRFDLGGTNCVVDAACASSLGAIHLAALELNAGRADMVITGGMDTFNDIFMYMCFSKTPALSPTGNSKPFAKDGDGTILGEGLGAIILKRLDDAKRDGDKIYAILKGMGSSSDGRGNAIYAPSSDGQIEALWNAYKEADVMPRSIELIEAHGTGTSVGDAIEATALNHVYGKDNPDETWCAVGSVKSMIGHTKAAAGVAGLLKTVMALKHKVLPPSIKVDEPLEIINPGSAPIYLNTAKRPWIKKLETPRRAALSSFGFGGSNFHCVLEEAEETKHQIDWDGQVLIIALSAETKNKLIDQIPDDAILNSWDMLRFFAYDSCQSFKHDAKHRLTLVIGRNHIESIRLFTDIKKQLNKKNETTWKMPGILYSSDKTKHKLAFVFPGQGSQYVGMGRDLACQFPHFFNVLERAHHFFKHATGKSHLIDALYPIPVFSETDRKQQEKVLRETQNAQPAIGIVSLGVLNILNHFGIKADACIGHSYGELTALYAADVYDENTFFHLSRIRGELMSQGKGDRGAMVAVFSTYGQVQCLLEENTIDLVIANHNSPVQVVLSGATDQIERFEHIAKIKKIRTIRLSVAAAFHSAFVSEATQPFAMALSDVQFNKNKIPILSNTTAKPYPNTISSAKKLLAEQLANPVHFVEQVEKLYADGIDTFIEVGPGKILTGLIHAILDGKDIVSIATDASVSKKQGQYDLATLLATLAAKGHQCELSKWDEACLLQERPIKDKKPMMTVAIGGANIMMPRESRSPRKPGIIEKGMRNQGKDTSIHNNQQNTVTSNLSNTIDMIPADNILQITQQSILALQKMQEKTTQLHQQYLDGQEIAQKTIQSLLEQQQLMSGASALTAIPTQPAVQSRMATQENASTIEQTKSELKPVLKNDQKTQQELKQNIDIDNLLLKIVSEKTGYPLEMLSLDMSLDTDLGIDSIKRVEILSALQDQLPWLPVIKAEEFGTFQFLQHIVEFIASGKPDAVSSSGSKSEEKIQSDESFQTTLLEIVSEKTGYPMEMLSLDMYLDSDLGIDSIKRVEILSALQEAVPALPTIHPDEIASLKTLQSIMNKFNIIECEQSQSVNVNDTSNLPAMLLEIVAEKTGYPVDILSLDMHLDSELGIDSIKRVEIFSALQEQIPELPTIAADDMTRLRTLKQIIYYLHDHMEITSVKLKREEKPVDKTLESESKLLRHIVQVNEIKSARKAIVFDKNKEIWIDGGVSELAEQVTRSLIADGYKTRLIKGEIKPDKNLGGLIIFADDDINKEWLLNRFSLIRECSKSIKQAKGFLISITTLGGSFGFNNDLKGNPIQAGLCGIIKTADKEWSDVNCKSIDLDKDKVSVECIQKELLFKGPLEVSVVGNQVFELLLTEQEMLEHNNKKHLNEKDVIVISGGARGVTAEVTIALAKQYQCGLLLLGRSSNLEDEPEWLASLTDTTTIKKALLENAKAPLKPVDLEKRYQSILADREVRKNLTRIRQTGARFEYCSVDVTDRSAVRKAIDLVKIKLGNITGIIHAAGMLADRLIEDKTEAQFNTIFSTKVDGFENLLAATSNDELKLIILFSSITARLGRKGQVDYAAANEVLNKMAKYESQRRKHCRVLSVNWGPWNGGMVTSALKKLFEEEGVGIIDVASGVDYLMQEIGSDGPVETVVVGELKKQFPVPLFNKSIPQVDPDEFTVVFKRDLSVRTYRFLASHVINGQAVLPVAVIIEWFAHGALHLNPCMQFQGFDDFKVLKGVTLEADESICLSILAGEIILKNNIAYVPVELRSDRCLHASAMIVLADQYERNMSSKLKTVAGQYKMKQGEYYQSGQLFHGHHLHGIEKVTHCSEKGIVADVVSGPPPSAWMENPIRSNWLTDPLVLDSAFQMMILWSFQQNDVGSLPTAIAYYRQFQRNYPKDGVKIIIEVKEHTDHRASAAIEFFDNKGTLIALMDAYECVRDGSLQDAFKENTLTIKV